MGVSLGVSVVRRGKCISVHRFKAGPSQPRRSFRISAFKDRSLHLLQKLRLPSTKVRHQQRIPGHTQLVLN